MRESLTILAIILIVILTAALAVPYFIDWDAERGLVAAQLSNLTGQEVKIRGGVDLKLLPTPYLQLSDVELADPATGTDIKVAELHLEIALTALMRGEVDFTEARFVDPDIHLRLKDDALPLWRPTGGFAGQMRFERLSVSGGRLTLDDPAVGRVYRFDRIALNAEADALTGPFRGDGHFTMGAESTLFRFSTGIRAGDHLHFKLVMDENRAHPRADLEGELVFRTPATNFVFPAVTGTLQLSQSARDSTPSWQVTGALQAALRKARLSNLDLQIGDQTLTALNGSAEFDLGRTPRAHLVMKAKQLDLDKLLAQKGAPPPLRRASAALGRIATAQSPAFYGFPIALDVTAGSIILGGDVLSDVSASLAPAGTQSNLLRLAMQGPGGAQIALNGTLESGSAPDFKGHVSLHIADVPRLQGWLGADLPKAAVPADLPVQSFGAEGDANISEVGIVGSNLVLDVDHSVLTGTLAYTKKVGAEPARLFADLSARTLALQHLPSVKPLLAAAKDMDLALRFDAQAVKLANSATGAIETGAIQFDLEKNGPVAALKNLAIEGFDGADLSGSGHWGPQGGDLSLKLDAGRVDGIAGLASRLMPGFATHFIAAHPQAFSPVHLTLALTVAPGAFSSEADKGSRQENASKQEGGAAPRIATFSLGGTAGALQVAANAVPDLSGALDISIQASAHDSRTFLRQLGLAVEHGHKLGAALLTAKARGHLDQNMETNLTAALAGTKLDFHGDVTKPLTAPQAKGTVDIASGDLTALLRATGFGDSGIRPAAPFNLHAMLAAGNQGLDLQKLSGLCAGERFGGTLDYGPDKGVTGSLKIDRFALGALLQLALGPPGKPRPGALWSDAAFGPPTRDLPSIFVAFHADDLDLWPGLAARGADFDFSAADGQVSLKHLAAKLGGAPLLADLTLRRNAATAAAEGHLSLENYPLDLPTARGLLSGKLDFAGTGQSAAALVSGLAGSGTLSLTDPLLPRSDPGALARVFQAVEEERLSIDETEIDRALGVEFDKHPLALNAAQFDLGLAAGVLRLSGKGPSPAAGKTGVTQATEALLDLRTLRLDQHSLLTLTALPRDWSGPPPQVAIEWSGALRDPVRNLDATNFVNALAARAIARETARIAAQEFDVHEHAIALARFEAPRRIAADREAAIADIRHAAAGAQERQAVLLRLRQLLAAEKKKAAEKAAQKPLPINPAAVPAPVPRATIPVPADPSAAGRY